MQLYGCCRAGLEAEQSATWRLRRDHAAAVTSLEGRVDAERKRAAAAEKQMEVGKGGKDHGQVHVYVWGGGGGVCVGGRDKGVPTSVCME
jgi:hypothetical protein